MANKKTLTPTSLPASLTLPQERKAENGYTLGGERDTEALAREGRAVARPLRAGPARRLHGDRRRVRTAALPVHKGGFCGKAAHPEVPRAGT